MVAASLALARRAVTLPRGATLALGRRQTHYPVKRLEGVDLTHYVERRIRTSPFRLNLIAGLVRRMWVPEALTQLKYLNKRFAPTVATAIQKAANRAGMQHEVVPEELEIERCFVTPAPMLKSVKFHAKGRMGIRKRRSGHLSITLAKIDFPRRIADAENARHRAKWERRHQLARNTRLRILGEWADKRMFPPKPPKGDASSG
mmetsp:Transcript_10415/g.33309  ORF Transcript_10415/g.33309 Transcript_10415/m.33309 type:complete len:203 (+) Transcript_10415:22-630(+)